MKRLEGLEEVVGLYEGFILDLWGVVHDGEKPFAQTIPTLQELKRARRKVWMLSNAPRRCAVVAAKLTEMGVTPDLYDGIVTSGEATFQALRDKYLALWGKKIFHIGRANDISLYEGLDVASVKNPAEADFVLNSGVEDFSDTPEKYRGVLEEAAARKLPMICANADRIVHVGEKLVVCAGALADIYDALGGKVEWFGKPHRTVYRMCLEGLGTRNILAVGDGMQTDIAGAVAAGLDSALVVTGIHRDDVGATSGVWPDENRLQGFAAKYLFKPTYISMGLIWNDIYSSNNSMLNKDSQSQGR